MTKVIGLTGGIGSGKSTVTKYLLEKGYRVIDADLLAKEAVEPGKPALEAIRKTFGDRFIDENGRLKRKEMAALIVADAEKKKALDAIVHGEVIAEILAEAERAKEEELPLVFLDVPLLFEVGLDKASDEVWLVSAPEEVRIRRVMERDGIEEDLVRGYMANQLGEEEKREKATRILDNGGTREELREQIDRCLAEALAVE